ncbi:hypothetical protein [Helicobacter trogontum]|uniref:hypothetical protein n=1 Tax=Helicobacter trogontum TaxID=50960 RepID=UPI000AC62577|nr:hypothetical protein [Helicobacter trogontum]
MKKFVVVKREYKTKMQELQNKKEKISLIAEIAIRILYQQEKNKELQYEKTRKL